MDEDFCGSTGSQKAERREIQSEGWHFLAVFPSLFLRCKTTGEMAWEVASDSFIPHKKITRSLSDGLTIGK